MTVIRKVTSAPAVLGLLVLLVIFMPFPHITWAARVTSSQSWWGVVLFVGAIVSFAIPRSSSKKLQAATLLGVILLTTGAIAKFAIAQFGDVGFHACFQINSPITPDGYRDGACEKTYEWTAPEGASRRVAVVDFGSRSNPGNPGSSLEDSTWNLSAINHHVYGYFDWDPRLPLRERLPITAYFAGSTKTTEPIKITFVGQGVATSGQTVVPFVPNHETPSEVILENRQSKDFFIEYTWLPESWRLDGPYAHIRVTDLDGNALQPDTPAIVTVGLAVIALVTWVSAVLIGILAFTAIRQRLRRSYPSSKIVAFLALSSVGWAFALTAHVIWSWPWGPPLAIASMFWFLLLVRVTQDQIITRVTAALLIAVTATIGVLGSGIGFGFVPILRGGDDFLMYEAFAREILIEGSLRAGEDVFWFAPGIRYTLFLLHMAFGDSSEWIWIIGLLATIGAGWLAISRLLVPALVSTGLSMQRGTRLPLLVGGLGVIGLGLILGSDAVWRGANVLFSEFPAWVALIVALTLAFLNRGRPALLALIGAMLGVAVAHRSNQIPGALLIAVTAIVFAYQAHIGPKRAVKFVQQSLLVFAPFVAIAGLVLVHNWHYGRSLQFTHDPKLVGMNTVVTPAQLLEGGESWNRLLDQLRGILLWPTEEFPIPYDISVPFTEYASAWSPMGVGARFVQIGVLIAVLAILLRRPATRLPELLLFLIPASFLVPHIVLTVTSYYPRHTVAGYLTGAIILLALAGQWINGTSRSPSDLSSPVENQPEHVR